MKLYISYVSIDNNIQVTYHSVICMAKNEGQAKIIVRNGLKDSCFCGTVEIMSIRESDVGEIFIL